MLNGLRTTIQLQVTIPTRVTAGGVGLDPVQQITVEKKVIFNTVTDTKMGFDNHGNITMGTLEEGDAEVLYQGSEYDWTQAVKTNSVVLADGQEYSMILVKKLPRGFYYMRLKRLKGK